MSQGPAAGQEQPEQVEQGLVVGESWQPKQQCMVWWGLDVGVAQQQVE